MEETLVRSRDVVVVLIRFFIAAMLLLGMASTAQGGGPRVVIGTGPDYPPFSDQGMVKPGVATELVTLVFQRMDYTVELERKPWNRLIREARQLQYAAIYPYVVTPEREQDFLASDPLFDIKLRFFGLEEGIAKLDFEGEEDPLRLCRPNGYALNEDLRPYLQYHDEVEWIRPPSMKSCFLMLERERVDLVPINLATGVYTIHQTFDDPPPIATLTLFQQDATLHLLVPRALPGARALLDSFNGELERVKQSAEGKRILGEIARFLSEPHPNVIIQ